MQGVMLSVPEITAWVGSFIWPFIRVAALFGVMPVLGAKQVPRPVRILLSVFVTWTMMPLIKDVPAVDPLSSAGLLLVFNQILIGVVMGYMLLVVFNAILMGAESIAITMGLGFALMSDPQNGVQIPVLGQFYQIMATLLFLALDGHHAVLQMMADSFIYLPVGELVGVDMLEQVISWTKVLFTGALQIALPAIITLLTINIVMGVMTRASPQLNVFSVGFPVTMTMGFLIITMTMPSFLPNFQTLLSDTYFVMGEFLRGGP